MGKKCVVYRLGTVAYETAWKLQDQLAEEIASEKRSPALLLLEHPHTFTFGRSGHIENLVWDEQELARRGISVHWVDRGGDVTYHGPGQLVGYPLLPLGTAGLMVNKTGDSVRLPQADYVGYLRNLEKALIYALSKLGLHSVQIPGLTGVWVPPEILYRGEHNSSEIERRPAKIAAIGVKVDVHGISRHGFALNVNPEMSFWEGIIGCGLKGYPITSLAELLDPAPLMQAVADRVVEGFREVFGFELIEGKRIPGIATVGEAGDWEEGR